MSSQESTMQTGVLAGAPGGSKKRRGRVVKKRRRAVPAPPSRLGWLGGGMTSMIESTSTSMTIGFGGNNDDNAENDIGNDNNHGGGIVAVGNAANANDGHSQGAFANDSNHGSGGGSGNKERLLTPREDYQPAAAAAAAIDLTGDNDNDDDDDDDEFTFKDSPPIAASKKKNGQIKSNVRAKTEDTAGNNDDKQWACRNCTLLNPESSSVCDACNARRESSRSNNKLLGKKKKNGAHFGSASAMDDDIESRKQRSSDSKKKQTSININSESSSILAQKSNGKKRQQPQTKNKKPEKNTLLKWASSQQSTTKLSQQSFASGSTNNKKSKLSSSSSSKRKQNSTINTEMWIDKHAPKTTKELCVAPKKIDEVRNFLNSHMTYTASQRKQQSSKNDQSMPLSNSNPWEAPTGMPPQTKLMILVGSPGIGKSAMVRTLAQEMNVDIVTWNDAHVDYNMNQSSLDYNGGGYLPYQSQLKSFEEFLLQGGVGMESLDLGEMAALSDDDGSLNDERGNGRMQNQGGSGNKKDEHVGSLILVEEIPNLYNAEAAQSFRNIMERHIQRTQIPTFFIFSDVQEGKHNPGDLEQLIAPHILYSPLVQILPIQPATKAKMKKCLTSIAKAERLSSSMLLSPEFFEETHLSSGGDLRHAIFAMQFRCSTSGTGSAGKKPNSGNDNSAKKDSKLSTFHALGKLLYAKRKQPQAVQYFDSDDDSMAAGAHSAPSGAAAATALAKSKWDDGRGPLEFVPEDVLNRIDMGIDSAITFLSYHSPDFFTDATDLSRSFDLMSDAMTFGRFMGGRQADGPFPTEYASCIGGRAVADGNLHPAPSQFRQFSAPKVFSVMKKNRENVMKIDHLRKRLSMGGGGGQKTSIHDNIGSAHHFITDSLPYMRTVIPQDVNYALANLHSYAKDSSGQAATELHALEEENNVLLEDDLVDDNDW